MKVNKEKIISRLLLNKSERIENLINLLENENDYFTVPASTKYHEIILEDLQSIQIMLPIYFVKKNIMYNLGLSNETMIICGLLHDIFKCDFYKESVNGIKKKVI